VDDLWATKSEDVELIVRTISFARFSTYVVMIHQHHRWTDRQTDRRHATARPHFALQCTTL